MSWKAVGNWIKENAGTGAALVGSLLVGNVPGAVAAGVSLVSGATGTDDPVKALQALQQDPQTMVRLKELYFQNEADVRRHIETMERLKREDDQHQHQQTQETIRAGDASLDEYVRKTRPKMARESWYATMIYCLVCLLVEAYNGADLFNIYVAGILSAPAWAYLGLRTTDKVTEVFTKRQAKG